MEHDQHDEEEITSYASAGVKTFERALFKREAIIGGIVSDMHNALDAAAAANNDLALRYQIAASGPAPSEPSREQL